MPTMANITVKKHDGTTDIVYSAMSPSSGDGVPAIWKSTTVGVASAHQPELRLSARDAGKGASRALRGTFQYPQIATDSTTGLTTVVNRAAASLDVTFPKGMSQTDIAEFSAQFGNLLHSTLIQACLEAGYSAS